MRGGAFEEEECEEYTGSKVKIFMVSRETFDCTSAGKEKRDRGPNVWGEGRRERAKKSKNEELEGLEKGKNLH